MATTTARIVHYGLGPVGCAIARELLRRGTHTLVGAVDRDPVKVGRDLGALLGHPAPLGLRVRADSAALLADTRPDLVVLTTTSRLRDLMPQAMEILTHGAHVLSTCEELAYPWTAQPALAHDLDARARKAGRAVLATGVNPGFVMDHLPTLLSGLSRAVQGVRVERFLDAAPRRQAFRTKVGAGLAPDAFARRIAEGTLRHMGLPESVHMVAAALGWPLDEVTERIAPVLAQEPITAGGITVAAGHARGVEQVAEGLVAGTPKITLHFRATIGEPTPHDRVVIDGTPPLEVTIAGGVNGDLATCNVVVNAIPAVRAAAPGLRTMLDIGPLARSEHHDRSEKP